MQLVPFCAEGDIELLSVCDQCVNGSEKRVARYSREYSNKRQNWKFDFDTTDTLRYWYDDLAELFSCSQEEIATECDYFIAQFQITNKNAREWRNQYLLNEDYYKTSNGHGSIPTVETLEKYAEWHSMFYVADEFRQSRPQIIDDDISYEKWLNKFLPGKDGFWCFEFRNHIPLISFLWKFTKLAKRKPKREYIIPDNLAETMIEHNLGVSLNMEYHAHFEQSNQYIRIESAFVEKEDIEKLITELQKPYTALSYFNYDPEEYGYRNQSDFSVYPTCEVITTFPDYALDKKDLLLKDYLITSNYLMGVSNEFAKHLSVTKQEQILHSRVYNSTSFPVQTYHWSEPKNESGYEKHSTYGNLVTIEKKCLLNILQNRNQAIVFEVTISFEDDSYRFHGTPSKPAKKKYLYSLETNNKSKLILLRRLLSNDDV